MTRLSEIWAGRSIAEPCIVAELSGNHNGNLQRALALIDAAAEAGVDAIKLQTYTADTITLNSQTESFIIENPTSIWHGRSFYDLYREAQTPWEWHSALIDRACQHGLDWFSSPFDPTAVTFLHTFKPACYKIASPEIVDHDLISKCAQTGKPLIISTGMATICEIAEAVDVARSNGCNQLALMKCTSNYPASPAECNLRTIAHMAALFCCPVGFSDHTLGIGAAVAATAVGAAVIEKHLTLRRNDGGPDAHFSLEPHELKAMVKEAKSAFKSLGGISYGPQECEKPALLGRRSLFITVDMQAGDVFSALNVRSLRPAHGMSPRYLGIILGKTINQSVMAGTPLSWELIG